MPRAILLPLLASLFFVAMSSTFAAPPVPKFERQVIDDKVTIGYGVAIGDVDGDGKPDILLADKKQFAWFHNGDWKKSILAEDLTPLDNVCIAARDIDGSGKVSIAVGAGWNPSDTVKSGSVHYLIRPADPTQKWEAVALPHEPTVHRMAWVKVDEGVFQLIVLPLHGRGNKNGEGAGVKVLAYDRPADPKTPWETHPIEETLHMTHNFAVVPGEGREQILLGSREGMTSIPTPAGKIEPLPGCHGIGEIRPSASGSFVATIEPMHGNEVVVYRKRAADAPAGQPAWTRVSLDASLKEGHALACADFLGTGSDQVVAGWRTPDAQKKVGIRLYVPKDNTLGSWDTIVVDDDAMACEDLKVADLDGDGKPDLIASGRATHNLVVYWNRTGR